MDHDSSTTRRGYLKATGAGVAALSFAGCVSGGGDGSESDGSENGGGGSGENGSGGGSSGGSGANGNGGSGGNASGGNSSGGGSGGQQSIVIGSDIPYKPFEYKNNQGETVGFDVDIADAVFGEQLGLTPQFQSNSFDTIIPSLNNGNFRVIMSAMTINDERAKKVDFSDPYFTAYQTIVGSKTATSRRKRTSRARRSGSRRERPARTPPTKSKRTSTATSPSSATTRFPTRSARSSTIRSSRSSTTTPSVGSS